MDYLDNDATDTQIGIIESKLSRVALQEERKQMIRDVVLDLSYEEASELIYKLSLLEVDPITSGFNYSQRDILKHLNKLK